MVLQRSASTEKSYFLMFLIPAISLSSSFKQYAKTNNTSVAHLAATVCWHCIRELFGKSDLSDDIDYCKLPQDMVCIYTLKNYLLANH